MQTHAVEEGVCSALSRCPSHGTAPQEGKPLQHGDNDLLPVISVPDHESGCPSVIQIESSHVASICAVAEVTDQ